MSCLGSLPEVSLSHKEEQMKTIEDVVAYLKKVGTYYIATDDGGQPRVRPFGTAHIIDGHICIQTGKRKAVSRQIHRNPRIEICACDGPSWLRVSATAEEDDRRASRKAMLDAYPELRAMYSEEDGNTEIFRLTDGTATFSSFGGEAENISF